MQVTVSTSAPSQSLSDRKSLPLSTSGPSECKHDSMGDGDGDSGDDDSDSEVRRVPEAPGKGASSAVAGSLPRGQPSPLKRRRNGASADKENKRLKRLLRNRVSAQQARERKKAYLSELEEKYKEMEQRNAELEERVSTLQGENMMLRQIVKNTTMSKNGGPAVPSVISEFA
eukprot:TRINITY_DN2478_c0_g1_i1.p1 TRINITY_DN2478_c0_g1~~TRINITY_DN2478_c0_g1_i1.p1  ORF type:complete len:172 (+),score=28.92 TRINITY_DN2478_c0_g1_i1:459-974(+)